jgi:hypothetical protein
MSGAYFITGVADELLREGAADHQSASLARRTPSVWSFLQLLCNLIFVLWIYISLESIMKQLNVQKQFAKLVMYKSLAWSLAVFVLFFTVLTIVSVARYLVYIISPYIYV